MYSQPVCLVAWRVLFGFFRSAGYSFENVIFIPQKTISPQTSIDMYNVYIANKIICVVLVHTHVANYTQWPQELSICTHFISKQKKSYDN